MATVQFQSVKGASRSHCEVARRIRYFAGAGATLSPPKLLLQGLKAGTRVRISDAAGTVLLNVLESGGVVNYTAASPLVITVEARNASGSPPYKPWTATVQLQQNQTTTVTAQQERDDQ